MIFPILRSEVLSCIFSHSLYDEVILDQWDVSQEMSLMFYQSKLFNQSMRTWDIGNVVYMSGIFDEAEAFTYSDELRGLWPTLCV